MPKLRRFHFGGRRRKFPYRKRPFFKRKTRRGRSSVPRQMKAIGTGTSDRAIVHLRYGYNVHLVPGAPQTNQQFVANTLFRPLAADAHSPLYVDQWQLMYNQYRVFALSWRITVNNINENALAIVATPTPNASFAPGAGGLTLSLEQRMSKMRISSNSGGAQTIRMRGKVGMPRVIGYTPVQYKTDTLTAGIMGSNPSQEIFLNFYFQSVDGLTNINAEYVVDFIYHAELFDRVNPLLSS